ncbi:hypothetical protein L7F22_055621 [Adiantum nelumboides]|nr:hypothetical protein [Adiantum nelumboides]
MFTEDDQLEIDKEFTNYMNGIGASFTRAVSLRKEVTETLLTWWHSYGRVGLPNLSRIALRILSQDCSAGACERNWSAYSVIHTKIRNRLSTTQLEKLVYCRANMRSNNAKVVKPIKWAYSTKPVFGWGDTTSKQKATAGWLAALPVFEPHWQVCMASGLSTGWIEWGDRRFEFQDVPSYVEKNWGGTFPKKWFWAQCNAFKDAPSISLTVGGGRRYLPLTRSYEEVALVAVHYEGKFYEFVPWKGPVEWEIRPWGYWHLKAHNAHYEVELEGTTKDSGTALLCPTESGLAPLCRDTFFGDLKLVIRERTKTSSRGKVILSVTSDLAALEVGGGPWDITWKNRSESSRFIKPILGLPIDLSLLFARFPSYMPAGL